MKKLNNKGFGIVGILIVVVIVGLIGAVGWLVYDRQKSQDIKKDNTSDNQKIEPVNEASDNIETSNDENVSVVKFSEIGYQIKVPNELKDLKYVTEKQTDPYGNEVIYLRLSSDTLLELDSLCTAEASSLGLVGKGIGNIDKLKEDDANYFKYFGGDAEKQFDGTFVFYSKSRAACGEDKSMALQQDLSNKLKDSFNGLESIK